MSKSRLASGSAVWSSRAHIPRPALLTQVSIRPNRATAASASRSTSERSATSRATARASPPSALIRAAASSRACPLRAARTTLAPRLAAVSAVARPMPDDAPVITITCSDSFFNFADMMYPAP